MKRGQKVEPGQLVQWDYPHDDIESGVYVVVNVYPPTGGSGTYVQVAKTIDGKGLPALPEELTIL